MSPLLLTLYNQIYQSNFLFLFAFYFPNNIIHIFFFFCKKKGYFFKPAKEKTFEQSRMQIYSYELAFTYEQASVRAYTRKNAMRQQTT